jgi:hypothetical protein
MANASLTALSLVAFTLSAAENPEAIETEKIDQDSYRRHLTGTGFDSADEGRVLLIPKAAELCAGQSCTFGKSRFTWKMTRDQGPEEAGRQLTQEVHCGDSARTGVQEKASWLTAIDEQAVMAASREYFRLRESGRYREAYEFFDPSFHKSAPFEAWHERVRAFHASAGDRDYRRVYKIMWYRKPPDAPAGGVYVDLDFVGGFANSRVLCTHLVWHEGPGGSFVLVSEEEEYMHEEREEPLANQCHKGSNP